MSGFNLPPGCRVSDIPGNTPADLAAEAAAEFVSGELMKIAAYAALSEDAQEAIALAVDEIGSKFYGDGYSQGAADGAMGRELSEEEE